MGGFDIQAFSDIVEKYKNGECGEYIREDAEFSLKKLTESLTAYENHKSLYTGEVSVEALDDDEIIKKFKVEKDKPAIYLIGTIMSIDDIRRNSRYVTGIFDKLIEQVERVINLYGEEDKNSASSKIILSQIIKIRNEYDDKVRMFIYKSNKYSKPLQDVVEKYIDYITDTVKDFIEIVVMGVWRGFTSDAIYNDLARVVNGALKEMGIYTADVEAGNTVDFDICTIADDDGNEETDDNEKIDRIKRVQRYPYLFSDDSIILNGKVNVWRDGK